jgi:small subunit ribosomal protein S10e
LFVIKTMQSLRSRGFVKELVSWSHYYWYLTNEGICYLRDFLHLPPEVVPATLKTKARLPTDPARTARPIGGPTDGKAAEQARTESTYRRDGDVQLRGGFGRGRAINQAAAQ